MQLMDQMHSNGETGARRKQRGGKHASRRWFWCRVEVGSSNRWQYIRGEEEAEGSTSRGGAFRVVFPWQRELVALD